MRAHLAEAVGTFVIVLLGCGAIAVGRVGVAGVAAAFGLAVGAMIYALGPISGAHLNPAVSIGFAVARHVPWRRVVSYSVAQLAGATAAALVLAATLPGASLGVTAPSGSLEQALTWEVALTFVLMLVIMAVATDTRAVGQGAAIAVGGTVALGALVGGPISGAAMNPARSFGPALVAGDLSGVWLYVVGPVLGAVLAAVAYRYLRGEDQAGERALEPVATTSSPFGAGPVGQPDSAVEATLQPGTVGGGS